VGERNTVTISSVEQLGRHVVSLNVLFASHNMIGGHEPLGL